MDRENLVNLVFDVFSANPTARDRYNPEKAYHRFLERKQSAGRVAAQPKVISLKYFWIAAAVSAVCLLSGITYTVVNVSDAGHGLVSQVIDIPDGSRAQVTLPDGSVVWLNGGSVLSYDPEFGERNRNLRFEGEGCFDIAKNTGLPLIVRSGDAEIRVLGTKFNFRNYNDEDEMTVSLLEGRISFSSPVDAGNGHSQLEIYPNQMIRLDKATKERHILYMDASYSDDWIDGVFYFHGEPLWRIVSMLNHYFGTDISIADDVCRSRCFYGYYRAEYGIHDILKKLSADSFTYEDKGGGHFVITE